MSIETIITHPGKAHRDELLSVMILMVCEAHRREVTGKTPVLFRVIRKEPSPEALSDPLTWILDIGGKHDPAKGHFDHHQLSDGVTCTLSLLADSLMYKGVGVTELLKMTKWFEPTCRMDASGVMKAAAALGTTKEVVFALGSPVERSLLALFEKGEEWVSGGILLDMLFAIGQELMESLFITYEQVKTWQDRCQVKTWGGLKVFVVETDDNRGLSVFRDEQHPDAAISIGYDRRGKGWSLFRYDDHPRVDFTRVKDDPRVAFTHLNGFIATTRERVGLDEVQDLVEKSVIPS